MFSLFVLPFCVGVLALLVISVLKYRRWMSQFDKLQQMLVRKGILSWKFIGALWEAFREGLLHWRITRHNFLLGYMHRSLAFGWFLLIVVGAIQAALAYPHGHPFYVAIFFNFFEPRSESIVHFPQAQFYANLMDALLLYVFSGLLLAMFKKVWSRPMGMRRTTRHNLTDRVAKAALWSIFPLRLMAEAHTAAIYGGGGFLVEPLGGAIASMRLGLPILEYPWWLCYSLALGTFFTLMPFTRYMHIFTEVLLIYFRQLGLRETSAQTGYTKFEMSACSRCGLCIDGCPVNDPLGICDTQGVYLLQTIRNKDLFHRAEKLADQCLVCHRCSADCPVGIDLEVIRRQERINSRKRTDDASGYGYLKALHPFNAVGRVAYFGGCMSHLTPGITEAMERIFRASGTQYWYMDKARSICCGRPLLQQGYEAQARELRRRNTQLIKESGATLLVTSCPICYQSFTKEYNLPIAVMHHTQFIEQLLLSGKLKTMGRNALQVTYHDPCELGRGSGIYDAPRRVLDEVTHLLPTRHERQQSLCCGFNLGNTTFSTEQQSQVREKARQNLLEPHPDMIATACPMCKKAFLHGTDTPVRDIAEIVAERIPADATGLTSSTINRPTPPPTTTLMP